MKYGQQRLAAGRKNFIFFLCPLDGEQFKKVSCFFAPKIKYGTLMLTSQDFPTQRHHKLFDSVEFLLLLAF